MKGIKIEVGGEFYCLRFKYDRDRVRPITTCTVNHTMTPDAKDWPCLAVGVAQMSKREPRFVAEEGRRVALTYALAEAKLSRTVKAGIWEGYHKTIHNGANYLNAVERSSRRRLERQEAQQYARAKAQQEACQSCPCNSNMVGAGETFTDLGKEVGKRKVGVLVGHRNHLGILTAMLGTLVAGMDTPLQPPPFPFPPKDEEDKSE